jgi:hypothetical protein
MGMEKIKKTLILIPLKRQKFVLMEKKEVCFERGERKRAMPFSL